MQVLVVHAHPDPDSFGAAVRDAAIRGFEAAAHEVHLVDLYAIGYEPWLTEYEHRNYESLSDHHPDPVVREHIDLVRRCDAFVLIFPTMWSGMPAILKGWLDRTMLPGVAFSIDPKSRTVHGTLGHVSSLIGITTYGSPRHYRWLVGDAGRRTLRALRFSVGARCRTKWVALDNMDRCSNADRESFLRTVEQRMAAT